MTLGGTLDITTLNGFTPAGDDSFTIMTGTSITGSFDDVVGEDLGNGLRYVVHVNPTSVVLTVASNTLSIGNAVANEGENATFDVTLTPPVTDGTVTVSYSTSDGTATDPADYMGETDTLTFAPSDGTETITIPTVEDALDEDDETFTVTLSNASGAAISDPDGTGTIVDDDPTPTLSVNSPSVVEGNSGTVQATFTVTLSAPSGREVSVDIDAQNGTATTADNDYEDNSDTLVFAPGQTSKTFAVVVNGDFKVEGDETFEVVLSGETNATIAPGGGTGVGTIVNDDEGAEADLQVFKGSSPTTVAVGDQLSYSLSVVNDGPGTATGVVLTDTLPAGTGFVSVSPEASCNHSAGIVTCNLGTIGVGSLANVHIEVTAPTTTGTITNEASATRQRARSERRQQPSLRGHDGRAGVRRPVRADGRLPGSGCRGSPAQIPDFHQQRRAVRGRRGHVHRHAASGHDLRIGHSEPRGAVHPRGGRRELQPGNDQPVLRRVGGRLGHRPGDNRDDHERGERVVDDLGR